MSSRPLSIIAAAVLILCAASAQAAPLDLAQNGGFETGDFTGWTSFPSAPGNITIATPGSASSFAASIDNTVSTSASLIKNANIGVSTVIPGETVTISFDARGSAAEGGVAFAEFFSEIGGGGVSASVILGGGPLALDADPATWKSFSFTTPAGPDVSGGVTLQLAAVTAAIIGSESLLLVDNVTVTVERETPVPGTGTTMLIALMLLVLGTGMLGIFARSRAAGDALC